MPYTQEELKNLSFYQKLNEDPSTKIIYNTIIKLLKTTSADTIIDEVLDRDFREL